MGGQECGEARASHLLLALDQERDSKREPRVLLEQLAHRGDVGHQRALVVGRAAAVDALADDGRLEWRRLPEGERVRRLHVVVAVDHHVGPARVPAAACEHDRVNVRLHDLDREAERGEQLGHEFLGSGHPLLEPRVGRDAREADEFLQLFNGIEHGATMRDGPVPANPERVPRPPQCLKWRMPVKTMAMPRSSAALMTSASRTEPPGWIAAVAPASAAAIRPSGKRKERLAGDHRALEVEPRLARLPDRDPRAVDARHLAGADAERLLAPAVDDRVGFHVLADLPAENHRVPLLGGRLAPGHHPEARAVAERPVAVLHEHAADDRADLLQGVGTRAPRWRP